MSDEMKKDRTSPEEQESRHWSGPQNGHWPKALQTPTGAEAPSAEPIKVPAALRRSEKEAEKAPAEPAGEQKTPTTTVVDRWERERSYRPMRTRRDGRIGCLGGIMYAAFILCASIALACFAWMAASDVLALNKTDEIVDITLPESVFHDKEIELKDEDGNVTGTRIIKAADIDAVANLLRDYGVINYKWLFKAYSSFSDADEKIDAGSYVMHTNLDYRAIVKKMQSGSGAQLQTLVMLPEGYSMEQIFTKLEENGVCSKAELYEAASSAEFSYAFLDGDQPGAPERLEGFLFPDSYYFYQGMQASSAINKFLSNLYYKVTDEMLQRTAELQLTFRQILTIASLIEKEAANDNERALIASVIYNRLAIDMPLQFDSTVFYALQGTGITDIDPDIIQQTDSPYNTYLYTGLPPAPICNPGMKSIMAALYPENSPYLFFALETETNTMHFFIYAEEHAAFVATQGYGATLKN